MGWLNPLLTAIFILEILPATLAMYCYPYVHVHSHFGSCRTAGLRDRQGECCGFIRVPSLHAHESVRGPHTPSNIPHNCYNSDRDVGSLYSGAQDETSSGEYENSDSNSNSKSGSGSAPSSTGQMPARRRRRKRQTEESSSSSNGSQPSEQDACPQDYQHKHHNGMELCCFGPPHHHITHGHFNPGGPYAHRQIMYMSDIMKRYQGDYNPLAGRLQQPVIDGY